MIFPQLYFHCLYDSFFSVHDSFMCTTLWYLVVILVKLTENRQHFMKYISKIKKCFCRIFENKPAFCLSFSKCRIEITLDLLFVLRDSFILLFKRNVSKGKHKLFLYLWWWWIVVSSCEFKSLKAGNIFNYVNAFCFMFFQNDKVWPVL